MNNPILVIHIHELACDLLFIFMSYVLAHYSTLFKLFMKSLDSWYHITPKRAAHNLLGACGAVLG